MFESAWDWLILIIVALLLFGGANKIPQLARAFGRAVGEFRKGQMEVERELRSIPEGTQQINSGQAAQSEDRQGREEKLEKEQKDQKGSGA